MIAEIANNGKFLVISEHDRGSEESPTYLKINIGEFVSLYSCGWCHWAHCKTQGNYTEDDIYLKCEESPEVMQRYREILGAHNISLTSQETSTIDMNASFPAQVDGTSKIIWNNAHGRIHIALRAKNPTANKTSLKCIQISNVTRERFFADVKNDVAYRTHDYAIYKKASPELYEKWCDILTKEYVYQYKQYRRNAK